MKNKEIDFTIPKSVKLEAQRGLDWVAEFDRGGTSVGRTTARRLVNESAATENFIRKIARYFPRHEVDKEAEGFRPGEKGYPSNGRIAWALWGGDAGRDWSNRKVEQLNRMNKSKKPQILPGGRFEFKALEQDGEKYGIVSGYAATWDLDRHGDVIERGAFSRTLDRHRKEKRQIRMLWNHDSRELIGGFDAFSAREDDRGLYLEGKILLATQRGREVYELAKEGMVSDFSVGFVPKDFEADGSYSRVFKDVELYEVSIVSEPANPNARMTSVKSAMPFNEEAPLAARDYEWDADAAIARIREFTESADEPSADYRRAFLWVDEDSADDFEAYKMPIMDVIDGKMTVIPRAVFAAAAAMAGARGGVDIPDGERDAVIETLESYYEKMDMESPFEKGLGLSELRQLKPKEIKTLLRKAGINGKAAEYFSEAYIAKSQGEAEKAAPQSAPDMAETEIAQLLASIKDATIQIKGN